MNACSVEQGHAFVRRHIEGDVLWRGHDPFVARNIFQSPDIGFVRMLPDFGGIDISPIVLLLGIEAVQQVILPNLMKATM